MKKSELILISIFSMIHAACNSGSTQPSRAPYKQAPSSSNQTGTLEPPAAPDPAPPLPTPKNSQTIGSSSDNAPSSNDPDSGTPSDNGTQKNSNDPPPTTPAPAPQPPAPPPTTHKVTVDCNQALNIQFNFGGRNQPFRMTGGLINGQPTEIVTAHCPKIKAVLDQKNFPITPKPLSKPTGGDGLSASCSTTTLRLNYITGNPDSGTGLALAQGVDIESLDVCLEIRNIINGLMLKKAPPANL